MNKDTIILCGNVLGRQVAKRSTALEKCCTANLSELKQIDL